jgi:hypothetical protein
MCLLSGALRCWSECCLAGASPFEEYSVVGESFVLPKSLSAEAPSCRSALFPQ